MQVLIHRMNQTAHISLQKPAISKSARQNRPGRLNFGTARLLLPQSFCQSSVAAVSVRGFLRPGAARRKGLFRQIPYFFAALSGARPTPPKIPRNQMNTSLFRPAAVKAFGRPPDTGAPRSSANRRGVGNRLATLTISRHDNRNFNPVANPFCQGVCGLTREYLKLCVWRSAHAVKTGHLLNRSG